jgi:hypothetical protein
MSGFGFGSCWSFGPGFEPDGGPSGSSGPGFGFGFLHESSSLSGSDLSELGLLELVEFGLPEGEDGDEDGDEGEEEVELGSPEGEDGDEDGDETVVGDEALAEEEEEEKDEEKDEGEPGGHLQADSPTPPITQ